MRYSLDMHGKEQVLQALSQDTICSVFREGKKRSQDRFSGRIVIGHLVTHKKDRGGEKDWIIHTFLDVWGHNERCHIRNFIQF